MAGCFGSHPIDRWMERQLHAHIDAQDLPRACEDCPENGTCLHDHDPYDCGAVPDPREP
jgi:hypothetical protein